MMGGKSVANLGSYKSTISGHTLSWETPSLLVALVAKDGNPGALFISYDTCSSKWIFIPIP